MYKRQGQVKREIILDHLSNALAMGLVLEKADAMEKLVTIMESAETIAELAALVRLMETIYPSIRQRNWSPQPLLDALVRGSEASEQIQRKRLFIRAIMAGMEQFPEEASLALSATSVDVLTRQMFELSMISNEETL